MASNDYHFITHWRVEGTVAEVFAIISDTANLTHWWTAAFPEVHPLEPGDERGIGKTVALRTRGYLPYSLFWQSRIVESREPRGLTVEVQGDFVGRGIWSFEQNGPRVDITFDWQIRVEKPLVRYLSLVLRPLFAANHRWAMARGEEGLRLELLRRRAPTAEEKANVPAPPGPRQDFAFWFGLGVIDISMAGLVKVLLARRKLRE